MRFLTSSGTSDEIWVFELGEAGLPEKIASVSTGLDQSFLAIERRGEDSLDLYAIHRTESFGSNKAECGGVSRWTLKEFGRR